MNRLFSFSHLNDLLVLTWMLIALTKAYHARVKKGVCALLFVLCLAGGIGSILLQEALCPHFGLYMLLFVVCGCAYSAVALKGSFLWKGAMTAVYACIVFQLGKVAGLVSSWLPEALGRQQWMGLLLFQVFAGIAAVFLARHAVTTQRKVPAVCWASLMAVALIGIGLAYYQMVMDRNYQQSSPVASALYSVMIVAVLLIVQHLCARVILSHERDLVRLSLEQGREGEARMARQAGRAEEELRRYRHETMNHIASLSALLDSGEVAGARQLLREIGAKSVRAETAVGSGNALVDAIVGQKAALCRQRGIAFTFDLVLSEALPLTDGEISSLLENLLNNALEAAEQCQSPFIRLRMYPNRGYLCIETINSADEGKLSSNPALMTSKPQPELHGIGLKVIAEIARRHQGMAFFDTDTPGQFTARIMVHF